MDSFNKISAALYIALQFAAFFIGRFKIHGVSQWEKAMNM